LRRVLGGAAALALALALALSTASADPAHSKPQGPAAVHFAADFPVLQDHEWGAAATSR